MLAGCGATKTVTRTVTVQAPVASGDQKLYGHLVSAQPTEGGWLVQFDPAWFTSGITASVAMAQALHMTCAPRTCEPVPNDNYVVDESHAPLTFLLPHATRGTVLTRPLAIPGKVVGADRLVQYVRQGKDAPLFEPLESGVWIRVHGDTITRFAQQYRP